MIHEAAFLDNAARSVAYWSVLARVRPRDGGTRRVDGGCLL